MAPHWFISLKCKNFREAHDYEKLGPEVIVSFASPPILPGWGNKQYRSKTYAKHKCVKYNALFCVSTSKVMNRINNLNIYSALLFDFMLRLRL